MLLYAKGKTQAFQTGKLLNTFIQQLKIETMKNSLAITGQDGVILINMGNNQFRMNPDGSRFKSKPEVEGKFTTPQEWAWAVREWKNPDGSEAKIFRLNDEQQKAALLIDAEVTTEKIAKREADEAELKARIEEDLAPLNGKILSGNKRISELKAELEGK